MATQKVLRFLYQSKNNATALTDVKAQIYVNDTAKAVGVNAIQATANANGSKIQEVDATNSPGVYEILITAADLTAWGVAQGVYSAFEARIDSASHSAPTIFRQELTVANVDDIDVKLGTPTGASVSADISALSAQVTTLQNAVLQSGVGAVLPDMIIPGSGTNTYRIPITIQNDAGALVDPTSNLITVGILNQAGTDRGGNLTGSSGSPATVAATRDSVGQYHAIVTVPSSAVEEQWIFSFAYTITGNAMVRYMASKLTTDAAASGFALQSTLLAVQSTVNEIATDTDTIITNLASLQSDVTNNVEGAGFSNTTDSLTQISSYMRANLYQGGKAV
jgi:hypothetical protein